MPHNHDWQSRIKAVEREYLAMQQAAHHFQHASLANPTILQGNLRRGEVVEASRNLEGTYIIRLFAEFETGARQYWGTRWDSYPRTADLLNALAARRAIPDTQRDNVHAVRDYRNALVHERENPPDAIALATARSSLCHFISFLPPQWQIRV